MAVQGHRGIAPSGVWPRFLAVGLGASASRTWLAGLWWTPTTQLPAPNRSQEVRLPALVTCRISSPSWNPPRSSVGGVLERPTAGRLETTTALACRF